MGKGSLSNGGEVITLTDDNGLMVFLSVIMTPLRKPESLIRWDFVDIIRPKRWRTF